MPGKTVTAKYLIFIFSLQVIFSEDRQLIDDRHFQDPGRVANSYLELPSRAVLDSEGRLYLLDTGAKCIFVWDSEGRFLQRLGRAGQGPGEFELGNTHLSHLAYDGESVVVVDGRARKQHRFRNLEFLETHSYANGHGLVYYFQILANRKVLVRTESYRVQPPQTSIYLTELDFSGEKLIFQGEITYFRQNADLGWDYVPFSRNPVIYADFFQDHFVVGTGPENRLRIFDLNGELAGIIPLQIVPLPISSKQKLALVADIPWLKPPNRVFWPEERELYSEVLRFADSSLLVARKFKGAFSGQLYSKDGQIEAFSWNGGVDGRLFLTGGHLIGLKNGEDDEIQVVSLKLK